MKTPSKDNGVRGYIAVFRLNLVFGVLMLMGSIALFIFGDRMERLGALGLPIGAVGCLFAAAHTYGKYRKLRKDEPLA